MISRDLPGFCTQIFTIPIEEIVGDPVLFWKPGETVPVFFLDGDPELWARVEPLAHTWTRHANARFEFTRDPTAPVRVSFRGKSSWSRVGIDCREVPAGEPTMNLAFLTKDSNPVELSRTVLHEFGHALGFLHEHQHPDGGVPWNRPRVFAFYERNFGWSELQVEEQVLRPLERKRVRASPFDPESVMLYAIPPELTDGTFSVGTNWQLSALDREFAEELYRGAAPPVVEAGVGPLETPTTPGVWSGRLRLPVMVQDAEGGRPGAALTEEIEVEAATFGPGPSCERIRVADEPPLPLGPEGRFLVDAATIASPGFMAASAFGTALRLLNLVEGARGVGRPVRWAFEGPLSLHVRVPHRRNAWYSREERGVFLGWFDAPRSEDPGPVASRGAAPGDTVPFYTALSRDVVAHEVGHAVVDALAPDLHDATLPDSLGLHEALADLIAFVLALDSPSVQAEALPAWRGIAAPTTDGIAAPTTDGLAAPTTDGLAALFDLASAADIAERLGQRLDPLGQRAYLRSLDNQRTLDPAETGEVAGRPRRASRTEPHDLGEVYGGAVFRTLVRYLDSARAPLANAVARVERSMMALQTDIQPMVRAAGDRQLAMLLAELVADVQGLVLGRLALLPPGELTLGDLAAVAVARRPGDDAAAPLPADPDDLDDLPELPGGEAPAAAFDFGAALLAELAGRHVDVATGSALAPALAAIAVDPATLSANATAITTRIFAALGEPVPPGLEIVDVAELGWRPTPDLARLRPRLLAVARGGGDAGQAPRLEDAPTERVHVLRARWTTTQPVSLGSGIPDKVRVYSGFTAVFSPAGALEILLRSTGDAPAARTHRDAFLHGLVDSGALAAEPDGLGLRAEVAGGVLRVRGTGRLLHALRDDEPRLPGTGAPPP